MTREFLSAFLFGFGCGMVVGVIVAVVSSWWGKSGKQIMSSPSSTEESIENPISDPYLQSIIGAKQNETFLKNPKPIVNAVSIWD